MYVIILIAAIGQSSFPSFQPATSFPSFEEQVLPLPIPEPVEPNPVPVPGVQLIAFTSTWCGPCARMKPILAAMAADGVTVQSVDFDQDKALVAQYRVTTLPTTIVVRNGSEVARRIGVVTLETLRNLVQPFRAPHTHVELGGAVCTVCGGTCAMLRAAEAAARAKGDASKAAVQAEFTRMYGDGQPARVFPRLFRRWR